MASEKQIAANRANARKSPGPSTPEAKAKTRMNAVRDGITGQVITLSEEERSVFEKLKAELIEDLVPKTVMELRLANSIAWDTWRLDHLRAIETNLYALGRETFTRDTDSDPRMCIAMSDTVAHMRHMKQVGLMSLYEQRLNRGIHRNMEKLAELQAERKRNYERDLQDEMDIAFANEINGLPYQAPTRCTQNGIVFSTAEILAAANRQSAVAVARMAKRDPKHVFFKGAYENYDPNRPNTGPKLGAQLAAAA